MGKVVEIWSCNAHKYITHDDVKWLDAVFIARQCDNCMAISE